MRVCLFRHERVREPIRHPVRGWMGSSRSPDSNRVLPLTRRLLCLVSYVGVTGPVEYCYPPRSRPPPGTGAGICRPRVARPWSGRRLRSGVLPPERCVKPAAGAEPAGDPPLARSFRSRATVLRYASADPCPRRESNPHWRRPQRRASTGWATRTWAAGSLSYLLRSEGRTRTSNLPFSGALHPVA